MTSRRHLERATLGGALRQSPGASGGVPVDQLESGAEPGGRASGMRSGPGPPMASACRHTRGSSLQYLRAVAPVSSIGAF